MNKPPQISTLQDFSDFVAAQSDILRDLAAEADERRYQQYAKEENHADSKPQPR